jgi:hypothetical protein
VQLAFAPGEEAQVDLGEMSVIVNGRERKVQLFCVRQVGLGLRAFRQSRLFNVVASGETAFADRRTGWLGDGRLG